MTESEAVLAPQRVADSLTSSSDPWGGGRGAALLGAGML